MTDQEQHIPVEFIPDQEQVNVEVDPDRVAEIASEQAWLSREIGARAVEASPALSAESQSVREPVSLTKSADRVAEEKSEVAWKDPMLLNFAPREVATFSRRQERAVARAEKIEAKAAKKARDATENTTSTTVATDYYKKERIMNPAREKAEKIIENAGIDLKKSA